MAACYKRLKRQVDVDRNIVPASASLTNVPHPIVVHVNGALRSSPVKSSTPLKRGYSLEDLDVVVDDGDDEDVGEKIPATRRMSLDSKFI